MTTTNYIWDEQNYLAETDVNNVVQTVYTNEPQQYGNLISSRISGTTSYHHFDAIGSTRQLTNTAATVTDTMIYEAWGSVVNRTGATGITFQWVAVVEYYFDVETGKFYVRKRIYDPVAARWTAPDTIGPSAGNVFEYSHNRVLLRVDPSGLLSYKFVPILRSVKCRRFVWSHDWVLGDGETNGFILQRNVAWDFGIECGCKHWFRSSARCPPKFGSSHIVEEDGCPDVVHVPPSVDPYEFWELWVVEDSVIKYGKPPQLHNAGALDADTISMIIGFDACGKQTRSQFAYWYEGDVPPGGWDIWMIGGGTAGALAWTCGLTFPADIEESLSAVGPSVTKETVRTFCCCPKDPDRKIDNGTATANGTSLEVS